MSNAHSERMAQLDLEELGNAIVRYDELTDTLYLVLSNEEADETLLLPNDVVVHISKGKVIAITIRNVRARS